METDGKRILKVQGDPAQPFWGGMICNKMQHYERQIHSPNRILNPLKRVGEKGEGRFERISWEQAVQEITDRWKEIIKESGPDAIMGVSSSGTQGIIQKFSVDALFNKMGACRMVMTLCSSAKEAAYQSCVGGAGCLCPTEMADSDYIMIWGSNVKATRIHFLKIIEQVRKRGKKVVLIEACACDTAKYCDEVVLVRPGSDGALALAMMHVLERESMMADEYLKESAVGFEEFKATLSQYTPEWAQQITGVPAEVIERLAREYGSASAPSILLGTGPSRHGNGGMNCRLIMILSAVTGAWRKPGGGYAGRNPKSGPCVDEKLVSRPEWRTHFGRIVNINLLAPILADTKCNSKIRAFYIAGGNPVNSVSDQKAMIQGLKREDLFTVVHERVMTDTAKYADIILPATYSVECTDCYSAAGYCTFGTAYKVIEPPGECKSNWDVAALLAKGMGYEEEQFSYHEEKMLEILLEHPLEPLTALGDEEWNILRKGGVVRVPYSDHTHFPTPSGRFQIVDESQEHAVPCYIEDFDEEEPLRLIAVPNFYTLNSIFFGREDLIKKRGTMRLIMNPEDAGERGIKEGDEVVAFNDLAEVPFTAAVSELITKGAVAVSGVYDLSLIHI